MSLINDRYDALWLIVIKLTFKLIEFTGTTIDDTGIGFNSCQSVDVVAGNNDGSFFKSFSSYNAIAIESCFVNALMDCYLNMVLLFILIQFEVKMDTNSSLLLIFNAIYSITSVINNILSNTASETVVGIFFRSVVTRYGIFWQLSNSLEYFIANLIQIKSNTSNTSKNSIDTGTQVTYESTILHSKKSKSTLDRLTKQMHDIQLLFTVDNSQMLGTNCKWCLCDESLTFEFADLVDYNIRDDQSGQSQADTTAHSRCKLYDLLEAGINLIFSNFGLTTRRKNTKRHKNFIIQVAYEIS